MGLQWRVPSLVKQTLIYGIPSIVGRFLNFLLVPLYTYLFVPAEYGIVTEFYAYMAFFMVLLTYGMETTFFRFVQKYKGEKDIFTTSQWSLTATSLIFLCLALGIQAVAMHKGGIPEAKYITWFAVILVMDSLSALPFCKLRNENKAFLFASIKSVNIALNIGLNLFFIVLCKKWGWYNPSIGIAYIFISNLIASAVSFLLLGKQWGSIRFSFDRVLWKEMMKYTLPIMIWGMAGIINETFDRMILRTLIEDRQEALYQLGIYGACYKISIVMTLFVQAFKFAAEPFFFKQAEKKDAGETYAKVMQYFVFTCAFIFLVCMLNLNALMYFVGEKYRVGVSVVPILLMANLFLGIFYNLSVWYKITDRTKVGAYISLMGAAITIGLNFLLIPFFGYVGAAWTTLCCYFFIALVSYLWGQKEYPIPYPIRKIVICLLLVTLLAFCKQAIPFTNTLQEHLYTLFALFVFGMWGYFVFRLKNSNFTIQKEKK